MQLLIVSGSEASGKTFIARTIAERTGFTYQSKDSIKEQMFDTEQQTTWDYNWYEKRAKKEFFRQIKQFIDNGTDVVIESNFIGKDKKILENICTKDIKLSEVNCSTRGLTGMRRFVARNESGRRHKGHHDRRWYFLVLQQNFARMIGFQGICKPLNLNDRVILLDTTDMSNIDFDDIVKFITS